MIYRRVLLVGLVLTLAGCLNKDQKMVDLSAFVFIIFLGLVGFKYAFPVIASSSWVKQLAEALNRNIHLFIFPLYAVAICLVIAGFYLSGIHGILIFIGLVVGVIAVFLRRYTTQDIQETKKRMLEIVFLGIGILAVLTLMWIFGADMFSDF